MQHQENGQESGGPMWSKFWNSFANECDDTDSIAPSQSASNIPPSSSQSRMRGSGNISPIPEIHPSESASAIDDGSLNSFPRGLDENHFTFKFKAPNGKSHRFTADFTSFENIHASVMSKLPNTIKDFSISYVDDEEDLVAMSTDEDVYDAVQIAKRQGATRVLLCIQEIHERKSSRSPRSRSLVMEEDDDEEDEDEDEIFDRKVRRGRRRSGKHRDYLPIPHDLLLPGALLALAVAIVGVFAISKSSR